MAPEIHPAQTSAYDLTHCDREPIHQTRFIQPHGILIALSKTDLNILQASANVAEIAGRSAEELLGKPVSAILDAAQIEAVREHLSQATEEEEPAFLFSYSPENDSSRVYDATMHLSDAIPVLELESVPPQYHRLPDFYHFFRKTHARLGKARTVIEYCQTAAEEVRRITGFDRVMVYRFDEEWNGEVVAEDCNPGVDSYLGLHYPASDIPAQARELYRKNWVRIVPNVAAEPVAIIPEVNPATGKALDLSASIIRSLSPIHVQYLKNMGVMSSMSISIIRHNRLWGLIACHHMTPNYIPYRLRVACELLGQQLSLQLTSKEDLEEDEYRFGLQLRQRDLIKRIQGKPDIRAALLENSDALINYVGAHGLAIYFEGRILLHGQTPSEEQTRGLVAWLSENRQDDVFATNALSAVYPAAAEYGEVASGVMVAGFSTTCRNFIIWFRPEVVETVNWAGNPNKPVEMKNDMPQLMPRTSFELWKERVRGKSLPWKKTELETVSHFRTALTNLVLARAAEDLKTSNRKLSESNKELESFAYIISHDLSSLVRKMHFYSEKLDNEAQQSGTFSSDGISSIARLQQLTMKMHGFINDILALSRVSSNKQPFEPIDLDDILKEVLSDLDESIQKENARIEATRLPVIDANPTQIYQLMQNLISNSIKYHRDGVSPVVKINAEIVDSELVRITFEDNGIGFRQEDSERIFDIFERLHAGEEKYSGTGIGLAICKKIIEKHNGTIEAFSVPEEGARFIVSLPITQRDSAS